MHVLKSVVVVLSLAAVSFAAVDPNFHIYLLFGQSNMAGGAAGKYDGEGTKGVDDYCDTTPRIKVLAWGDCNTKSLPCPTRQVKRTFDQWYTAFPPYHNCEEGIGPADGFGKTLLDSINSDISIGFVPCALSGQAVEVFVKGNNRAIDSHTQPKRGSTSLANNGYGWMLDRCKIAQKTGVIKGILFHQGEANSGNAGVSSGDAWVTEVANIVKNLKTDLGITEDIPFIAGEMRYDGCCKSHNTYVNKLPSKIPKCAVASADGIERRLSRTDGAVDNFHFSTKGTKEFGQRYAQAFLKLASPEFLPRKGSTKSTYKRNPQPAKLTTSSEGIVKIYTLNGHVLRTITKSTERNAVNAINTNGVYIVSKKLANGKTTIVPCVKN